VRLGAGDHHAVVDHECGHSVRAHLVDGDGRRLNAVLKWMAGCHVDDRIAVEL